MVMRRISAHIEHEALLADLERYRELAIGELGATDAKVITTDMVLIDERVRMKCSYPKCMFYGTNAHCPPHAPDLDEVRTVVSKYRYAIFTRADVPSDEFAGPAVARNSAKRGFMRTHELVTKIESAAFYDGYHLAMGFACGACKSVFCPTESCSALVSGSGCRHPSRARGAMECAGMDVFAMAARAGWDVYPIGGSARASEIPCAASYGLVLIH
jgi:predicted metal-binding protein